MHVVDATVFWSPTGGGVGRYVRTKRRWLIANGHRHSIVAPALDSAIVHNVRSFPIPCTGGYRYPLRREHATRVLCDLKPDVIEVGDPYVMSWAALDAGQRLGVPVVAFCHSNVVALLAHYVGPWSHRLTQRYLRRVYRDFDLVVAPSHWMARQLYNMGVERVEVQALGVDVDCFHPGCASTAWRARLGFTRATPVLIYAGRFSPEKNLDVLSAAVTRLGPPYTLVALGAGPSPPQGPRVKLLPYVQDSRSLAIALASADAFVHAGNQETFGLSVLEAMACGTPVIASAEGGCAELLHRAVSRAVRSPTPAAYAEAIEVLLHRAQDPMRTAARAHAVSYRWERCFGQMMTRYERLQCGKRDPAWATAA